MKFKDKVVLITGAANGIGKATAAAFAEQGAWIVIADKNKQAGEEVAAKLNQDVTDAHFVECDVSQKESVDGLFQEIQAHYGTIDIAVNNAGVNQSTPFLEMSDEEWDRVIETDLKGPFLVGQAAARMMVHQSKPGVIINISSVMAVLAMSDQAAYCAAKGGVNQLTKSMALALIDHGIRVNCVAPGPVMTALMKQAVSAEGKYEKLLERMPARRVASCEEIARVILFLADEAASYFVGQTIYPDGGRIIQAFPKDFE